MVGADEFACPSQLDGKFFLTIMTFFLTIMISFYTIIGSTPLVGNLQFPGIMFTYNIAIIWFCDDYETPSDGGRGTGQTKGKGAEGISGLELSELVP